MSDSDADRGWSVILGIAAVGVGCWFVWTAVIWVLVDWRWLWIGSYTLLIPALAFAVIHAWGEPRPFVPAQQPEAWITAVLTAVAAAAPVIVLPMGWGTGTVALLLAICIGAAALFLPNRHPTSTADTEDTAPPHAEVSPTE